MEFLRNQRLCFALQNFDVYLVENIFLSTLKKKKVCFTSNINILWIK